MGGATSAGAADDPVDGPVRTRTVAVTRRRRRLVAVALGVLAVAAPMGAGPMGAGTAGAAPAGERCEDETHLWVGDGVLDGPGSRLDTGLDVPVAAAGVGLTVVGVSADGTDTTGRARPLAVYVGGVRASSGAAVTGGDVIVVHEVDQAGPLRVVGVTVVLRRCTLVASAAPTITAPPAAPAPASPAPVTPAPATPAPAVPVAAPAVPAPTVLPETGGEPWGRSLVGASLVALGCAMVSFGRRRAVPVRAAGPSDQQLTAGGPEPGSPRGAAPHAPR